MYNFILQILLMLSLAAIIYLIARAVPRIGDLEIFEKKSESRVDKLINRIPLEKIDLILSSFLEKILRKIKLFLMRWDNAVSGHLQNIKKNGSSEKENKPTLFDE